ncbi:MAG TPA: DUF6452 family protein [Chitinophagaceae bacterium]|nr:DUF6452 family protein [Chitinophagaceae bacterium]
MKYFLYVLGAFFILFSTSCGDDKECNSPVKTPLGIGFFQQINQEKASDSMLPALSFHPIGTVDTSIQTNINAIYVPLNPHNNSTQFYIRPDTTLSMGDTISISYTNDLQFVSAGCGFKNVYHLDTVQTTHHHIDSIRIKLKEVNVTQQNNIEVFY